MDGTQLGLLIIGGFGVAAVVFVAKGWRQTAGWSGAMVLSVGLCLAVSLALQRKDGDKLAPNDDHQNDIWNQRQEALEQSAVQVAHNDDSRLSEETMRALDRAAMELTALIINGDKNAAVSPEFSFEDAWGQPFRPVSTGQPGTITLASNGPDKTPNTADDITKTYAFVVPGSPLYPKPASTASIDWWPRN